MRQTSPLIVGLTLALCALAASGARAAAPLPTVTPQALTTPMAVVTPSASASPKGPEYCPQGCMANVPVLIHLHADHIRFYYDRYLIEADGHVRVTTSDGITITGDAFSMDLKLNRFMVASHVHLTSPHGTLDGAAVSDFLSFQRLYFVPVISKPDRWTYLGNDFSHPLKGREMPGDVFYFPDLQGSEISLTAKSAVIDATAFVRFQGVITYLAHIPFPLPSYYIYFGTDQDLAQNSLSGASFDLTWNATGDANAITALHARYDSWNKAYLSFEQHLAGPHDYAVFSVNPATKFDKYWNLVTGHRLGKRLQINTFTQLYTLQSGLSEPKASAQVTDVTVTQALNQAYLQSLFTQTDYNMLCPGCVKASPNHPSTLQITDSSFDHRIFHTPFYEQVTYGFGFNHDSVTNNPFERGLQVYGGVDYTTIWNHLLGYTLYLPGVKFGDLDNAYRTYYFNAALTSQRQWFSVPHHINTATSSESVSRQFSREVSAYASYTVTNTSDIYNHGGYAAYAPLLPDGQKDYNFLAFRGAATLRTATLSATYSASPNLLATLTFSKHHDFPLAVPGLFSPPPVNNIGQYINPNYLGQPPFQLGAEVRARIMPHLVIDVQRTYYFNFGTQKWSPSFVVQFSQ